VGPPTFLTDFLATPSTGAFEIFNFQPTPQFSGQNLFEPRGTTGNTLTIDFHSPIDSVSFAFATNGLGQIDVTTPFGTQMQPSLNIGGTFPGGMFTFSSASPFSTVQLTAFATGGAPVEFAIDNLTVTPAAGSTTTSVPEPSSLALLGTGAVVLAVGGWYRRRKPCEI